MQKANFATPFNSSVRPGNLSRSWITAGAVLCLLQQSLAGWEALETDLLEAANLGEQAAQLSERVRSATQVVVDAILDLLDAGIFW